MTLLLAIQSAFYSPAKYGMVRTLFGKPRLAEANGLIQALTIGANVLAGTVIFTAFFETWTPLANQSPDQLLRQIAPLGWLLVVNSVIQVLALYRLSLDAPPTPGTPLTWQRYIKGSALKDNLRLVASAACIKAFDYRSGHVLGSVGQVLLAAFPAYTPKVL